MLAQLRAAALGLAGSVRAMQKARGGKVRLSWERWQVAFTVAQEVERIVREQLRMERIAANVARCAANPGVPDNATQLDIEDVIRSGQQDESQTFPDWEPPADDGKGPDSNPRHFDEV
jgi:hypothetical protein